MSARTEDALRIEALGKAALEKFLRTFIITDIPLRCYAYKSRVKSEAKLKEKVLRKTKEKAYDITDITDVIGFRCVTLFRREMPNIVRSVLDLITHQGDFKQSPFRKNHIKEIIAYHTPSLGDPYLAQIEDHVADLGLSKLFSKQISANYSSVHVVAYIDYADDSSTQIHADKSHYYVPIEIQIRTVFEDAWGEIDHKFGYSMREGKTSELVLNNPISVQAHLAILKKFTDASAEYADVIASEATNNWPAISSQSNRVSVGSPEKVVQRFKGLKVAAELIARYETALRAQKQGLKVTRGLQRIEELRAAADAFRQLSMGTQPDLYVENDGNSLFYFYCKMNEAFCLFSDQSKDGLLAAKQIYAKLSTTYKDFPIVWHRLGQTLQEVGDTALAISALERAQELLNPKLVGRDILPATEYEHMASRTPILLGYCYWTRADTDPTLTLAEQRILIEKAYSVTVPALTQPGVRLRVAHNNLLYYCVELQRFGGVSPDEKPNYRQRLEQHLAGLESGGEEPLNLREMDTYAKALDLVGRTSDACMAAEKTLNLALSDDSDDNDPETLIIAKDAKKLIASIQKRKPEPPPDTD